LSAKNANPFTRAPSGDFYQTKKRRTKTNWNRDSIPFWFTK
jgi:hypothetical protein